MCSADKAERPGPTFITIPWKGDAMTLEKKLHDLLFLNKLSRVVMTIGFLASAGGNVLHARKTPIGITISLAAPVMLFLAFELVSRIPIRKEAHWLFKSTRIIATGSIATIMAIISYRAQRQAFHEQTGDTLTATLLPGAIDALMVVGSISLIELGIQIRNLEAYMAGAAIKTTVAKPKDEAVPPMKVAELSKKERIAAIVARSPDLDVREIAKLADSSYNYAHSIVAQLRAPVEEMVPA